MLDHFFEYFVLFVFSAFGTPRDSEKKNEMIYVAVVNQPSARPGKSASAPSGPG